MAKLDLLNDSLNFDESLNKKVEKTHEDLSDLSFSDESPTSETESVPAETESLSNDDFLADLELNESEQATAEPLTDSGESSESLSFGEALMDEATESTQEKPETISRFAADPHSEGAATDTEESGEYEEEEAPFNFGESASSEEESGYYSYDDEGFDSGNKGRKGLFIFLAIFFAAILGGGIYFLFFKGNTNSLAEKKTPQNVQQPTQQRAPADAVLNAKLNSVQKVWSEVKNSNAALVQGMLKLNSLSRNARITMIRYRDGSWILTAIGKNRDKLASLNRDIRNNFSMKELKYININSIKSDQDVVKIADISFIPVALTNVSPITDAKPFLNLSMDDVQSYFKEKGLTSVVLNPGNRFSGNSGNTLRQFGFISAKGKFDQIAMALDNLEQQLPQLEILRLKVYSTNLRSIFSASVHFEMEFNFHQANIK